MRSKCGLSTMSSKLGHVVNITGHVLNTTGQVVNITGQVVTITGQVIHITGQVGKIRVFVIYQIVLGRKTYTPEYTLLCNRRTPQPKANPTQKKRLKVAFGPLFSHSKYFFVGWD